MLALGIVAQFVAKLDRGERALLPAADTVPTPAEARKLRRILNALQATETNDGMLLDTERADREAANLKVTEPTDD